jgi:hypothetical protein
MSRSRRRSISAGCWSLIESVPEFDQKVLRAPKGKGMEAIELKDGSRILFKTRTGGGGRGLTGDLVVLDEAMIITLATTAALVPTMAARSMTGNPQIWYTGSAVDQQKHEHGVVLARVRERGVEGRAAADVRRVVRPEMIRRRSRRAVAMTRRCGRRRTQGLGRSGSRLSRHGRDRHRQVGHGQGRDFDCGRRVVPCVRCRAVS